MRVDQCALKDLYTVSDLFHPKAKLRFSGFNGDKNPPSHRILLSLRLKKTYQWEDQRDSVIFRTFVRLRVRYCSKRTSLRRPSIGILKRCVATGGKEPDLIDIEHISISILQMDLIQVSQGFPLDLVRRRFICGCLFYQIRNCS